VELWIASCGFGANVSRRNGIYSNTIGRVLKSCTANHHIQTRHRSVINRMTWPGLLSCRRRKYGSWALSYSKKRHTYWQDVHGWTDINLLYQIPLGQVTIDATHKIDDSVTENDCIKSPFKIPHHCMHLIGYLQGIDKVNFVRINLFQRIISRQSCLL